MTQLDRDLERLFAADSRARAVRRVVIAPRSHALRLTFALAGAAAAVALAAALALLAPTQGPAASPAVPPSAPPTPSASPDCAAPLRRAPGEPVVGGSKIEGGGLEIRRVRVSATESRWVVVFATNSAEEGGRPLDVAPAASLHGPDGDVPVLGFEGGPDEDHTTALAAPLRILPCSSAVLVVRTAPVRSGEHTLTLTITSGGRTTSVPVFAPLTCAPRTSDEQECVNTRGTRPAPATGLPAGVSLPPDVIGPREYASPLGYSVRIPAGWRRSDLQSRGGTVPGGDADSLGIEIYTRRTPEDERRAMDQTHVGPGAALAYTAYVQLLRNLDGLSPLAFAERQRGAYGFEAVGIEEVTAFGRTGARTTWRSAQDPETFYAYYVPDDAGRMWRIGFFTAVGGVSSAEDAAAVRGIVEGLRFDPR